jgi:hypothetical protein
MTCIWAARSTSPARMLKDESAGCGVDDGERAGGEKKVAPAARIGSGAASLGQLEAALSIALAPRVRATNRSVPRIGGVSGDQPMIRREPKLGNPGPPEFH